MTRQLRPDLCIIAELVKPGSTVLDVGCSDGALLSWLRDHKQVYGRGIELSKEGVSACLADGLSVIQGDADTDLAYYPDKIADYVILSQTLQALRDPKHVVEQLVRIGERVILSVPNFGYWRNRLYLGMRGRMPVTKELSYQWYDTPNIHFCTIRDFIALCEMLGLTIEKRIYTSATGRPIPFAGHSAIANFIGVQGVFVITKNGMR